ncbi:MAG: translation initiation factor IF-2 [Dehalococcoidia bacterium]|nr:translation initiation factor IF-2 [Dehalococcoidia bacterium]
MTQQSPGKKPPSQKGKATSQKPELGVSLPSVLTVKQMADLLGITPIEAIKQLMRRGIMASVNQAVNYDDAAAIATDLGRTPVLKREEEKEKEKEKETPAPKQPPVSKKAAKAQKPRPPVVTVLGHVDHGKTSLLDAIRHSNVADKEAGAITQHIGAYQVTVDGKEITFIDTPGHEAFTAMRARGASVTDIAILVVAADDGIMPQTLEAIDHVRAANVPIIVAINKMDKPNADAERVKKQLGEQNLIIEEWGGEVLAIPVSAKKREGISTLLEHILIVAELAELKANPDLPAKGIVLEAKLDNTKGMLATLLVQDGTLKAGDIVVVENRHWGKVKAMFSDKGKRVKSSGPSTPVEIMGLSEVPQAGDAFTVAASEHEARLIIEKLQAQQQVRKAKSTTLTDISSQIRAGETKAVNLILKADVQGSIEPIKNSLERLQNNEIKVRIVHSGSGNITESDVMLAVASNAIIIGFNSRVEPRVKRLADSEGVEMRNYQIIYRIIEDMEKTVTGMLEPTYVDVTEGHAEVRALFKVKSAVVAGCYVMDGKVTSTSKARVIRKGKLLHESNVNSLRHFKDHVKEMGAGSECGISIEGFADFVIGDILEFYRKEKQ